MPKRVPQRASEIFQKLFLVSRRSGTRCLFDLAINEHIVHFGAPRVGQEIRDVIDRDAVDEFRLLLRSCCSPDLAQKDE